MAIEACDNIEISKNNEEKDQWNSLGKLQHQSQ